MTIQWPQSLAAVAAVYIMAAIYILCWRRWDKTSRVPSGFGVLLPIILLLFVNQVEISFHEKFAFGATAILSLIYWIDDVRELRALTRIVIAILCGALLGIVSHLSSARAEISLLGCALIGAGICVVLVNVLNFYDGADLNLATLGCLFGAVLLIHIQGDSSDIKSAAIVLIIFLAGFSLHNYRPHTIYLGDSGSFALAAVITWVLMQHLANGTTLDTKILTPLFLPFIDVLFVLCIRIKLRHDLLSRNYLHLYQRLQIIFGARGYLIPQFLFVVSLLLLFEILQSWGAVGGLGIVLIGAIFTLILYLIIRKLFLEKKFFFGDGT